MRLLVDAGYYKILFPMTCNIGVVIEAISSAVIVEEVGSYSNRVYEIKSSSEIEIKLLQDNDIKLPNSDKPEAVKQLLEIAKERDELNVKVFRLEAELKKIKAVIAQPDKVE